MALMWERKKFNHWRMGLSQRRRAADDAALAMLFGLADESPTLKEALSWAKMHDVAFYIDHMAKGVAGHYSPGTGVVGLSLSALERNPLGVLGTLAHEIRHAWQDYHGLRKALDSRDLATAIITQAMVEADAAAFGERVREEYLIAQVRKAGSTSPAIEAFLKRPVGEDLAEKFLKWFTNGVRPASYANRTAIRYAKKVLDEMSGTVPGLPEAKPRGYEFSSVMKLPTRLDIRHVQDVMPLGASFTGGYNYFSSLDPDALVKIVIRPSLANTFWGAADDKQCKMTAHLRKADLVRNRRGRLPRHPWP